VGKERLVGDDGTWDRSSGHREHVIFGEWPGRWVLLEGVCGRLSWCDHAVGLSGWSNKIRGVCICRWVEKVGGQPLVDRVCFGIQFGAETALSLLEGGAGGRRCYISIAMGKVETTISIDKGQVIGT
jgi:hypothetical protein